MKALNNDVERNLRIPLVGIERIARESGITLPEIRVAVRTGDTPAGDRQKMLRRRPQILITTPESLYLMLTSPRARHIFATTHTLIVDEIHTLVGTKRGAHLAMSLERLERLANGVQRIGLSATVRPTETAARFLGGQDLRGNFAPRPVTVVVARTWDRLRRDRPGRSAAISEVRSQRASASWPKRPPRRSNLGRPNLSDTRGRRLGSRGGMPRHVAG